MRTLSGFITGASADLLLIDMGALMHPPYKEAYEMPRGLQMVPCAAMRPTRCHRRTQHTAVRPGSKGLRAPE